MQYIKNHIPKSVKRPETRLTPLYLTIHSTGNAKSTAANERSWLTNPANSDPISWHICVDDKEVIEAVPLDEIAYHAGTMQGNKESIGIEICESGDRLKTITNVVELVTGMLHERNWGIDRLKRHYDWSGKKCPAIFISGDWQGWNLFKDMVAKRFKDLFDEGQAIEMRYNNIDEIPSWGKATIQKVIDSGAFADVCAMNLSEDMLRMFVFFDRLGVI